MTADELKKHRPWCAIRMWKRDGTPCPACTCSPITDEQIAKWVFDTYLTFGGSLCYAYQVAGLFLQAVQEKRP